MSVIIYIKRVHVEHRHLTDRDIYTIVNPLFSFLRCIFFLKMNEILRQQRNRLDLMFLCSRRIDIELTLFVFLPSSPPFFTIFLAHSSKNSLNLSRYRAEDIDA